MKKKKITIFGMLLFIFVASTIYNINKSYGNTLDKRQKILSKRGNNAIIISEIVTKNSIISEIIDQKAGYGYAQFELNEKGNYLLKTKMIRTQQYEPIVIDIIQIDSKSYKILMCGKSGLDYAEVIYTDNDTGKEKDPIRVEMNNQRIALIEAPEYSNYTRYITFYDFNGNKFE